MSDEISISLICIIFKLFLRNLLQHRLTYKALAWAYKVGNFITNLFWNIRRNFNIYFLALNAKKIFWYMRKCIFVYICLHFTNIEFLLNGSFKMKNVGVHMTYFDKYLHILTIIFFFLHIYKSNHFRINKFSWTRWSWFLEVDLHIFFIIFYFFQKDKNREN